MSRQDEARVQIRTYQRGSRMELSSPKEVQFRLQGSARSKFIIAAGIWLRIQRPIYSRTTLQETSFLEPPQTHPRTRIRLATRRARRREEEVRPARSISLRQPQRSNKATRTTQAAHYQRYQLRFRHGCPTKQDPELTSRMHGPSERRPAAFNR
jgi:hypothetical protein